MKKKILCAIGTRPEAIKMAPVILALRREPWAEVCVLATAQHRGLLDQVNALFGITPDLDLDIMQPNQSLPQLTSRLALKLDDVLQQVQPDIVLAQGDTTTVFMTALASFYRQLPFAHVEAGLRTGDRYYPFPEEMNRAMGSRLSALHFAPTECSKQNLLKEGVDPESIHVTGNTVIDALLKTAEQDLPIGIDLDPQKKLILITAHRRENFGEPFEEICRGLKAIVDQHQDVQLLYPVHPNPNVLKVANRILANHPRIILCEPLDYGPFISAMKRAHLILTDSGGVQEEAPALAVPVLVLRDETERPEALDVGVVKLVGPHADKIQLEANRLLTDKAAWKKMAKGASPYGDGKSAGRICTILKQYLNKN